MKTTESFVTPFPKEVIDWWLSTIFTDVSIVASRILETGYELVVEGCNDSVSRLIWILATNVVQAGEVNAPS